MPSHTGDLFAGQEPTDRAPQRPAAANPSSARLGARSGAQAAAGGDWALTAHCDGGARGNPGPAGYGAEIRDADGMVVAELSEFLGICSNNVAEYSGLLGCLQYALDHGAPSLRVISDSLLMVQQIQGRFKVKSPDLLPLWAEAKKRIAKLERFEITHALRHKNKAADRLANEAMDRGTKRPHAPGTPAPAPLRATPYPQRAEAPAAPATIDPAKGKAAHSRRSDQAAQPAPVPIVRGGGGDLPKSRPGVSPSAAASPESTMLRGFTRDGVIHILGSHTLPDGRFVKIILE